MYTRRASIFAGDFWKADTTSHEGLIRVYVHRVGRVFFFFFFLLLFSVPPVIGSPSPPPLNPRAYRWVLRASGVPHIDTTCRYRLGVLDGRARGGGGTLFLFSCNRQCGKMHFDDGPIKEKKKIRK